MIQLLFSIVAHEESLALLRLTQPLVRISVFQHPKVLLSANNACEKNHLWIQSTLTYPNEVARY